MGAGAPRFFLSLNPELPDPSFAKLVVMTKGGPADRTNFVSYYAYQLFDQGRYGEATAMATLLFAVVIALSLGAFKLVERGEPR